jgi:hypothetical protein
MNMSKRPQPAKIDPLHEARQAVAFYGEDITPEIVQALLKTIEGFHQNQKGFAHSRGPIAAKHYHQGHESAMGLAEGILLDSLMGPGQVFEDLLKRWSRSGAQWRALGLLRYLQQAHEAGIWK